MILRVRSATGMAPDADRGRAWLRQVIYAAAPAVDPPAQTPPRRATLKIAAAARAPRPDLRCPAPPWPCRAISTKPGARSVIAG